MERLFSVESILVSPQASIYEVITPYYTKCDLIMAGRTHAWYNFLPEIVNVEHK